MKCELYAKHHNIIDGIYTILRPRNWKEIPYIDDIDAEDDTGEFYNMFLDLTVYDIEDLKDFKKPTDKHGIKETIFIIRRDGEYYLCETQGDEAVKFATNVSKVDFIMDYDRKDKLNKLYEKQKENRKTE